VAPTRGKSALGKVANVDCDEISACASKNNDSALRRKLHTRLRTELKTKRFGLSAHVCDHADAKDRHHRCDCGKDVAAAKMCLCGLLNQRRLHKTNNHTVTLLRLFSNYWRGCEVTARPGAITPFLWNLGCVGGGWVDLVVGV
jgi:hypothetical protein